VGGEGFAIANMSLSGPVKPDDERCGRTVGDAGHYAVCGLTDAGVTSAVAAGNETQEFTGDGPATYSGVLTVTAMGDRDGVPGGLGGQFGCLPEQFDDVFAVFSDWAVQPAADLETRLTRGAPSVEQLKAREKALGLERGSIRIATFEV
jgi:hypothetical protein